MPFTFELPDGTTAVVLHSPATLTFEAGSLLRDEIRTHAPHHPVILLDMRAVYRLDSLGLGMLAGVYVTAKTHGARLKLAKLQPNIRAFLEMTQLLRIVGTFDDPLPPLAG